MSSPLLSTLRLSDSLTLRHAHASKAAEWRSADVFLWSAITGVVNSKGDSDSQLIACFNAAKLGPVTVSNILRWMNSLSRVISRGSEPSSELMIKRVSLRRRDAFRYSPVPGDNIMLNTDMLSPGDYGFFYQEQGRTMNRGYPFSTWYPMSFVGKVLIDPDDKIELQTLTESSSKEISARHGSGVCIISGLQDDTEVNWIFPGGRLGWPETAGFLHGKDDEAVRRVENLLTMRSDLYQRFWLSHSLAIDVDDNFRVRKFTNEASDLKGLPEWLPEHLRPLEDSFLYFREHFRLALGFYVAGGDIRREIASSRLTEAQFMKTVGVSKKNPPDEANYEHNKADWKDKVGVELLSIMWPLETLPEIMVKEVLGCDVADYMSSLPGTEVRCM